MSNPSFKDYFLDFQNLDFEISNRGGIDFKVVSEKLTILKAEPLIIDIAINGYSTRDEFNFEVNKVQWKDIKSKFVKGSEAQKDPNALTVKRALRLLAKSASNYIEMHKIETNLHKFNVSCPMRFCHLSGHFVVDSINARQLLLLWENFDKNKNTKIAESVRKVLSIRFGEKY